LYVWNIYVGVTIKSDRFIYDPPYLLLMKALNEQFEDKEFAYMKRIKGDKPWRKFILELVSYKEEEEDD